MLREVGMGYRTEYRYEEEEEEEERFFCANCEFKY